MIHLGNLKQDERKKLYSLIDQDKLRKSVTKKVSSQITLKLYKVSADRLTKKIIIDNAEEKMKLGENTSELVKFLESITSSAVSDVFKEFRSLDETIAEKEYKELDEETLKKVNDLKEKFDEEKVGITYESLVKSICKYNEDGGVSLLKSNFAAEIEQKNKEIKELKKEKDDINSEKKRLEKELQIANQTVENNRVIVEKYNKLVDKDTIKFKLSDVVDFSINITSKKQLVKYLINQLSEAYGQVNNSKCLKILAALYEMIKVSED